MPVHDLGDGHCQREIGALAVKSPDVVDQGRHDGAMWRHHDLEGKMVTPYLPIVTEPLSLFRRGADVQSEYGLAE